MNLSTQCKPAESAYTSDPRVPISEHFTRVDPFWWSFVISQPVLVTRAATANDPLGFSPGRLAQGEADVAEGRVKSLDDILNALRARLLHNGS